jgi:hypothetical protein
MALSADGSTLAIGANREASAATGVDGDGADNTNADSGAVYVFSRSGNSWEQQAYVKASNPGSGDAFGTALALSADGNTLAVGAPFEASSATGIDGDQSDDSMPAAGAVYVFVRRETSFVQQAYVKASNSYEEDYFGYSVALSADGSILAVGAEGEDGSSTGVGQSDNNGGASESGAVYVFSRAADSWTEQSYIKSSNSEAWDHFGGAVSLSGDGSVLAVGAYWEDSAATAPDGDQADNSADASGAAYLFSFDGSSWQQAAYLKHAQNDGSGSDSFGISVSLSADGTKLAVGAAGEASSTPGIDNSAADNSTPYAGAAFVFSYDGTNWQQDAYIKASNPSTEDEFGRVVQLSGDGKSLVVGAALEDGSASPPDGQTTNDSSSDAGAAYLFSYEQNHWRQDAYLKALTVDPGDRFGWAIALSSDGEVLCVGANRESSAAVGLDGDQADNSASRAGAVYIYPNIAAAQNR